MAKAYVKFSTPADLQSKALEAIEAAKAVGGLRKGTNEATKAIERGEAKLVVIAEDVDPEEIVMHMPMICGEKRVPYLYVSEKVSLGKAAGIGVGTAAVAITKPGSAESSVKEIAQKLSEIAPGAAPAAAAKPAAAKPAKAAPAPKAAEKK
jgi:large subunit ribosomal protein L7Ae